MFSATTRNLTTLERRSELDQTARIALDQMRRDLASLHPIQITQSAETDAATTGTSTASTGTTTTQQQAGVTFVGEDHAGNDSRPQDVVRFTATVSGASTSSRADRLSPGRGDLAEVLYKLDLDDATPERGLVRVINWQPGLTGTESQPEVTELAPMATSFDVRYYTDTEREGADAQGWCLDWQDLQQVPVAVAVKLGLTPDRPEAMEEIVSLTVRLPLRAARYRPSAKGDAGGVQDPAATAGTSPGAPPGAGGTLPGGMIPGGLGGGGTRPRGDTGATK
ncbi:MAG: hypothetical protein HZB16_12060 [Armatimonadetes bacterium]|nr:hypothetical protein [Armatimonadota bacterium]